MGFTKGEVMETEVVAVRSPSQRLQAAWQEQWWELISKSLFVKEKKKALLFFPDSGASP